MAKLRMRYFVLKPRAKNKKDIFATASQKAMYAYAKAIQKEAPEFATEVKEWAYKEAELQAIL